MGLIDQQRLLILVNETLKTNGGVKDVVIVSDDNVGGCSAVEAQFKGTDIMCSGNGFDSSSRRHGLLFKRCQCVGNLAVIICSVWAQ